MNRRRLHSNPRVATQTLPYHVTLSNGVDVRVSTLRYWREPIKRQPLRPREHSRPTLAALVAECERECAREIRRARSATPALLQSRTVVVAPSAPIPYQPRAIACDRDGYTPRTSYSRADLLALLVRAARYA
jgi:hypothetical protein